MYHPSWTDHSKRAVRNIYYLREQISLNHDLADLHRIGIRPIRYLHHLGMLIGESGQEEMSHHSLGVFYTEPDIRVTITEPLYQRTSPEKKVIPWGVRRISAPQAWKRSRGRGIRVAIIDTGISSQHPSIAENYQGGVNILSPYSAPEDYNGHGTHVAGIVAGRSQEKGIVGVAPRASLYAVKAFNRKGSANLSDLLAAINWCVEHRMHVINMSFGMTSVSEALRQAVQIAHRKGIIMIAATGNQGLQNKIDFPASYPETVGVGSISKGGTISRFSNLGRGVDIYAPGEKILSSWLMGTTREMSGTSMSVPHVTGTIALLKYLNKGLNPEQLRYLLMQTADPTSSGNQRVVNAEKAVVQSARSYS